MLKTVLKVPTCCGVLICMQVITGYIQYAFGLPPTQDAIVTNEGLGWDSLLKMEQSSWWLLLVGGVVPKYARTGWMIFFLSDCSNAFLQRTCDASTFAPSCRLSHSSPRDNYRKLHVSLCPSKAQKKRECSNVICVVLCTFPVTKLLRETQRSVVPPKKNLKAVQTFTTFNRTPELRGDFRI